MTSTIIKQGINFVKEKKQQEIDIKIPRKSSGNEDFFPENRDFEGREADLLEDSGKLGTKKVKITSEQSGFSYFLDGIERKKIFSYMRSIPIIYGYVAGVVLKRTDKKMHSVNFEKSEEKFYSNNFALYEKQIKELQNSNDFLIRENNILQEKIKDLEKILEKKEKLYEQKMNFFYLNSIKSENSVCSGCVSKNCPGPDLCGKKILYVGGRKNTVPKYKEIAQNHGAEFIYHDGGIESSKKTIGNAVCSADLVCCPVDCTSHDACLKLKKICKKTDKSFIPLKSSGASSFDQYLKNLIN